MTFPTIHMNGTGGKTLLAEYGNAAEAVRAAMKSLNAATLNGRDYYPQGTSAFESARDERISMNERLKSVSAELDEIASAIYDQIK